MPIAKRTMVYIPTGKGLDKSSHWPYADFSAVGSRELCI